MSKKLRVLIACEFSGIVREAFANLGHDAMSCDLLPTEIPGKHYQGNVLDIINDGFDLMIAHPPCTYLSFAGNHVWNAPGRESKRNEAMNFFLALASAAVPKICIENPQGYPMRVYRKPDQIIHPFYFGEPVKKRTCLWLKNLDPLIWLKEDDFFGVKTATDEPAPVYILHDGKGIHWTTALHGGHARSKSFSSIALAMAQQWGGC